MISPGQARLSRCQPPGPFTPYRVPARVPGAQALRTCSSSANLNSDCQVGSDSYRYRKVAIKTRSCVVAIRDSLLSFFCVTEVSVVLRSTSISRRGSPAKLKKKDIQLIQPCEAWPGNPCTDKVQTEMARCEPIILEGSVFECM